MKKFDISVIGGGPAGACIAQKLAQFGYNVVLIEKETLPVSSIGLSLTPGIHHWLKLLGISEKINQAGFSITLTTHVLWENKQPLIKNYIKEKAGFHVDRAVFDEILIQSAISVGVTIMRPCALHHVSWTDADEWEIALSHSQVSNEIISAKFLVEATGRKTILNRTKKSYLPKTIATYAYWKQLDTVDAISFVEAGKNQWYWGAPVNNKGYLACIFSDPKTIKKASSIQTYYLESIANSTLFDSKLFNKQLSDIKVCSATAYVDNQPISKNMIKVGDSAFSTDPLSSQGVQKAMKSAFQGAIVVNTLLANKEKAESALAFYSNMITTEVINNSKWTKQFYNRQNIYCEGEFWKLRKDKLMTIDKVIDDKSITINKWDFLSINPCAVIKNIPIVGVQMIETIDAVILEDVEEPFVFFHNISIVKLIKQMHNKQLIECLIVISTFIPDSNPMDVLKWLLYNRVICRS